MKISTQIITRKPGRALLLLAMSVILLVLAAGCGGGSNSASENKTPAPGIPDKDKDYVVQLGYYNCDHMTGACIAKDAGIFDELGLKVNVTGNGKVPEAMAAAQMDVGYVGNDGLMRAFLKGAPIMIAANNHLYGSHYLIASHDIKEPKDLIGKKLSIGNEPEKNNSAWVQWTWDLNIPVEGKHYEVFNMSDKDEYFALKAGQLDAFAACDPWASMAEYENTGHVMATDQPWPGGEIGVCCVYAMSRNFANEHPELAKLMVLAHTKALEHIYTKPVRSAEIFAENYKVPMEVALMTIWKKTVAEGRTLTWKTDINYFEIEANNQLKIKTLDAVPNTSEYIQTKFLDECGADDFDKFISEKVDPLFPVGMSYEDWKQKAYELEGKKA